MYNAKAPSSEELPSTARLIKSTLLALLGAGILLVTVVMPAEYGIDPTGIGELTGLHEMGEIRILLEEEAAQDEAAKQAASNTIATPTEVATQQEISDAPALRNDTTTLTLVPNEGAEIKVALKKGQRVNYEWTSTGKVNFDNHGDSKALKIDYHGYGKGIAQSTDKGSIEAAFDGKHGWFWRNRTTETVTITLTTNGEYTSIERVD